MEELMSQAPHGVQGTLDWLFSSSMESELPLGVTNAQVAKKRPETFKFTKNLGGNDDLLLDDELLLDFKPVLLVKRQLKVKHAPNLFEGLCDTSAMNSAGFSLRCVPTRAPQQVLVPRGGSMALGPVLPKRWLLSVYYEPKRRSAVEAALAKMNFDIVGFKEQAADAAEATDQFLAYRHGCGSYGLWVQQGAEEIEVTDGKALDADMTAWKMSYEANLPAIANGP
ncbi:unnamed protein product [Effrenium voratum]|uniref:Uncharacterized protein n=1 Tax=Effrenium voratum TaxID=2562239 RepID=A0AA36IVR8_9DINO|nr:unnamed protein product [Effrenium voratum]CAJ1394878.1 unnamed protein product [Effrenium voratum]CAJ1422687.1 unnamed protein product [Effrenium voratum]